MQPAAISSSYALHVAISPVACWFGLVSVFVNVNVFLHVITFFCTVPDAWRLWAGPRLAYCCG
jgi:uncharacterized membrane protein YkgB